MALRGPRSYQKGGTGLWPKGWGGELLPEARIEGVNKHMHKFMTFLEN